MKMFYRIVCLLTALTLVTASASAISQDVIVPLGEKTYVQTFSDVKTDNWAFTYIAELVERGAISGYPDGNFYPDRIVTREEFAKIMVVAAGVPPVTVVSSSYADVPSTYWASPFIEAAKPYMTAYQTAGQIQFKPTTGALREDIAVAVVKLKGYDTRLADLNLLQTMFSDVNTISASAQPYVALAVANDLISGYTDGTFRGQNTITRSEAAAILWRAFQYGNDNKVIPGDETTQTPVPVQTPQTTPAPIPTPTAAPTPAPTATPNPYTHTMDTAAYNLNNFRSMVLTNDGTVYYINGDTLCSSANSSTLNLKGDLRYSLKTDNKNKDFSLFCPYLAYDSKNDTVYLLGNEGGLMRNMVIYDVTNLTAPVCVMAYDLAGFTGNVLPTVRYEGANSVAEDVPALSNGALLVPMQEGGTYMVSPARGTVEPWIYFPGSQYQSGFVIGNQLFRLNAGMMDVSPITSTNSKTSVSIEGGAPDGQWSCAGPDGIYFWESGGLYYIDTEGWRHQAVEASKIDCVDLSKLPGNVWDICVNQEGTCVIYDNSSKSIRILKEIKPEIRPLQT